VSARYEFAIVVTKHSGARVVFGVYDDRRAADHVVEQLRSIGVAAAIERCRPRTRCRGQSLGVA
jgi:hypothetical protein